MYSRHDIADILFRRKWFVLSSSILLLLAIGAAWKFSGGRYESQMVLLVRNNRADIVVVPGQTPGSVAQPSLMDGQIATEVQLLTNRTSLREVEQRCKLSGSAHDPAAIERAILALGRDIRVAPLPKASIIEVRYSHSDPRKAAEVLRELLAVYTDQHLRAHGGGGTVFFEAQANEQALRLRKSQERLAAFQRDTKIVLLNEQKDLNLRRMMDLEASARETTVSLDEGRQRINALSEMVASLSPRVTTQVRTIPNQFLVERLNTMLVEMENRRTDLLAKFRPEDRLVKQMEQQIADTRVTLERASHVNASEQASDINPLRQNLDGELARGRITQKAMMSRLSTLNSQVKDFKKEISKLEGATSSYNDLVREVKGLEENYQLYTRKWEESRIADALDRQKIANITVVEQPEVPASPAHRSLILPIGTVLLGLCLILLLAVLSGLHGQKLYTPYAIYLASGIQVLATVPEKKRKR